MELHGGLFEVVRLILKPVLGLELLREVVPVLLQK
jgi:hypothetical protein